MSKRIIYCREIINKIETISADLKLEHLEKLKLRLEELTEGFEFDKQRIEQEIAILVDKSDVTEEIVRINSHTDQMLKVLDSDELVGKKLDFLAQEASREINTIGAKSKNVELSQHVINFKSELEKIREQIQNVE